MVFGGRSAEHRVSVQSARTVAAALHEAAFEVLPVGIAQDGRWTDEEAARTALDGAVNELPPAGPSGSLGGGSTMASVARRLAELSPVDAFFPIVHGTWGEDGTLQGLFEMLDVPYVGTGVTTSAVCMDKVLCKQVLHAAGIPVVPWVTVTRAAWTADADEVASRCAFLGVPAFVKPAVGGSSVGVRKVTEPGELRDAIEHGLHFDDKVLVEIGVVGRELECSVLGHGTLEASGVGEIVPGKDFYDYRDKYIDDGAELIHRAELADGVEDELRHLAVAAFQAVGGSGMARVDFLLDDEGPKINEINTLPGFTSISMYPKLWHGAGVPIAELVTRLVDCAERRHADQRRIDQGIKDWIASL